MALSPLARRELGVAISDNGTVKEIADAIDAATAGTAQQSSTATTTDGFTAGAGAAVLVDSTFTGNLGSTAYHISDIVRALKSNGILAQ